MNTYSLDIFFLGFPSSELACGGENNFLLQQHFVGLSHTHKETLPLSLVQISKSWIAVFTYIFLRACRLLNVPSGMVLILLLEKFLKNTEMPFLRSTRTKHSRNPPSLPCLCHIIYLQYSFFERSVLDLLNPKESALITGTSLHILMAH